MRYYNCDIVFASLPAGHSEPIARRCFDEGKIFIDMGREMPPSMSFLMAMSSFASWAWWLIPLLAFGGWMLIRHLLGEERLRELLCTAGLL